MRLGGGWVAPGMLPCQGFWPTCAEIHGGGGGGGGAGAAYRDHWGGARPASEVTSARNPRAERRVHVSIYFYNYLYIILTPQRINDD